MDFDRDIVRNCPGCNSTNIKGTISTKGGRYIQKIYCQECPYTNNREIGDSETIEDSGDSIDEE